MNYMFPEILAQKVDDKLFLKTTIRKKYKGKWYLQKFDRVSLITSDDMSSIISIFMSDVYTYMLFGKPNLDLIKSDGTKVFELDPRQEDEEIRFLRSVDPRSPYLAELIKKSNKQE